jgi:DNA topoisomerase VI subunit B
MIRNRDSQKKFMEISNSEFFEKNNCIPRFVSQHKSLFMAVRESLDNSLYACEENNAPMQISILMSKEDADQYTVAKIEVVKSINLCSFIRIIRHFRLEYQCQ